MAQTPQDLSVSIGRATPYFILINAASVSADTDKERVKIEAILSSAQQPLLMTPVNSVAEPS